MASGGSPTDRLPPPFPGAEVVSGPSAESDSDGEDIFTGSASLGQPLFALVKSSLDSYLAVVPPGSMTLSLLPFETASSAVQTRSALSPGARVLCLQEAVGETSGAFSKPMSPKKEPTVPVRNSSTTNGVHEDQDDQDLFADATVELSLDTTQNNQKKETTPVFSPTPSLERTANSSSMHQPKNYEELEEEEQEDQFELTVGVSDPEKIGDGMNAYVAYKVSTQVRLLSGCAGKGERVSRPQRVQENRLPISRPSIPSAEILGCAMGVF
ncbi:UNVERIFIED_CONTAM: hypothetical protein K2H54_014619 [Gekko kuhli]